MTTIPGSNLHTELLQLRAGPPTPELPQVAADLKGRAVDRQALGKAAEQFEAVFLNQLLKAMRNTVPQNDLFNSGGPTKFYRQMHDAELASVLASGPTRMGIAEMIVRQLAGPQAEAAAGDPPQKEDNLGPLPARGEETAPLTLERYRAMAGQMRARVAGVRLRAMAEAQGEAVADTLRRFEAQISAAADESGLDPALVLAVVMEESGGDPLARSGKGAQGLMQLMPATAQEMGVEDPHHPGQNLGGGARYLARMLDRYEGDLPLALAAYNAGPGNVDRAEGIPPFAETRRYVSRVLQRYHGLQGGTDLAKRYEKP